MHEVGIGLVGDRPGDQRLARSRRAVQQHTLGGVDSQPLENLGILQRQFHHLPDPSDFPTQPADVLVGDALSPGFTGSFLLDLDEGGGVHQNRARGRGAQDAEIV